MYWNEIAIALAISCIEININMRCIEMLDKLLVMNVIRRLTLTWDVLKFCKPPTYTNVSRININMRCIEILLMAVIAVQSCRLTLTWDVLKFRQNGLFWTANID